MAHRAAEALAEFLGPFAQQDRCTPAKYKGGAEHQITGIHGVFRRLFTHANESSPVRWRYHIKDSLVIPERITRLNPMAAGQD